jgi:hypothetical protein
MTYHFDPNETFIAVDVKLVIGTTSHRVVMALDTGSTQTVVDRNVVTYLGLATSQAKARFEVTTANGAVWVDEFRLDSVESLGIASRPMDVIAMDLQSKDYEGLLAKDFFRDRVLTIDFHNGTIDVQ